MNLLAWTLVIATVASPDDPIRNSPGPARRSGAVRRLPGRSAGARAAGGGARPPRRRAALRRIQAQGVNLDAVEHLQPFDDRRLAIRLRDGTTVVASRAASEELRRLAR